MSIILECIRTVGRGERGRAPLSYDQAFRVMTEYLNGEVGDDQMAMLLMLIRVQNETQQEIAGFVRAFQALIPQLSCDIDWPLYAGKRTSAGKPWHLLAARLLADHGLSVLLHGYHDPEAGREHAEEYLAALDIPTVESLEKAHTALSAGKIAYLPLHAFAPQAEKMLAWKNRYGLRTPINTVVRALNPGGGRFGVRGSFHPGFQKLHAEIEYEVGKTAHAVISFKGQSGESEYNPKVSQTVWLSTPDGVQEHYWSSCYQEDVVTLDTCPMGTPDADKVMMANSVIATMAAVLFTREQDWAKALATANGYWQEYVQQAHRA